MKLSSAAIFRDAEGRIRQRKESGKFWQDNVRFSRDVEFVAWHDSVDKLFNKLDTKGYKQDQKRKDFEILLANLLNNPQKSVSISMNRNNYVQTRYNKLSPFTIDLVGQLKTMNMIEEKKAVKSKIKGNSRQTRICATHQLLEDCPVSRAGIVRRPKELVILRDENKKLKEYTDTHETHRIREILTLANEVNSRANIRHSEHKVDVILQAIFTRKFTLYGRIHTRGFRHPQGFEESVRKRLTINGEGVIELDFKGLHPNLLYASVNLQCKNDPYNIFDHQEPEVRTFLKRILLAMLNNENFTEAERAANHWLNKKCDKEVRKKMYALGLHRARPFMELFEKHHKPIAHYFYTGKDTGLRIMNKDSKIALEIIDHFVRKAIPIIPVHDSFIVQEKYSEALKNVMHETYRKHTGFAIQIHS